MIKYFKELLDVLKSIDESLQALRSCVRTGVKHKPNIKHVVTSSWYDNDGN